MAAFVVLEGPEGAGKTSHARALVAKLNALGRPAILTREPGGTALGDLLRQILLPTNQVHISARSEVLLYCAARAQMVEDVVRPALVQGKVVICDRFGYSTIAYQGYGRGLDPASVASVVGFATGGLDPDLCILLDLPPQIGLERKRSATFAGTSEEWNRFEEEELSFHEKVRQGYLEMARASGEQQWIVLDGSLPFDTLQDRIMQAVVALIGKGTA